MIMAGGTGGHVMPGLAVAQLMRERAWNVVWLGNPNGMEASLVPKYGIPMRWVQFGGLRGKGVMTKLMLPINLLRALRQSMTAIRAIKPNVVLGLGGYISFPGGMMASLTGRPLVLHEQNSIAGLANKVLARIASRVLTAFPDTLEDAEWCGNPVRPEILAVPTPEQRYSLATGPLRVLVVGGSLGAQALNQVVPKALAMLPPESRPRVIHQSGKAHSQALADAYREAGVIAELPDFIDDMASSYASADLVICRAGAMTVSELAAVGVASLLVPFPFAVDDHQTTNARFLADQQAAILLPQKDLTPDRLAALLQELTREKLLAMAQRARLLAKPDAARRVADVCEEVAR